MELTETTAWKPLSLIAECSLFLLEYLQKGGNLRKIINREIDKVKNQTSILKKNLKKTSFKLDNQSDDEHEEQKQIDKTKQNADTSTAEETAGEEKKETEIN